MSLKVDSTKMDVRQRVYLSLPTASDEQLCALNVPLKFKDWVRIFDVQGGLYLLHYLEDGNTEAMAEVRHVRGTILDSNNNLVCRSFGYTERRSWSEMPETIDPRSLFKAREGTVIRVFFHDGKWHTSTHRKINATLSYWSNPKRTFGTMFSECMQFSFDVLDPQICYSFLMCHPDNRQVYQVHNAELVLIAEYNKVTNSFVHSGINLLGVKYPEVNPVDSPVDSSNVGGISFENRDGEPCPTIWMHAQYQSLSEIRSNEPNIRMRYHQLRNDPVKQHELVNFFQNNQADFSMADEEFRNLCHHVLFMYQGRFLNKEPQELSKEFHTSICKLHGVYLERKKANINQPISFSDVQSYLQQTEPRYVISMMKQLKQIYKKRPQPSQPSQPSQ
jgi:hypothetical protein